MKKGVSSAQDMMLFPEEPEQFPGQRRWEALSRISWTRIFVEAKKAEDASRSKYARWMLDVVLKPQGVKKVA